MGAGKMGRASKNIKKQLVLAERRYGYDEKTRCARACANYPAGKKRPPEEPAKECTLTLLKNEPH